MKQRRLNPPVFLSVRSGRFSRREGFFLGFGVAILVLGAAVQNTSLQTIFDLAMLEKAIRTRWPKSADRNLFALQAGAEAEIESVPADAQQILHP